MRPMADNGLDALEWRYPDHTPEEMDQIKNWASSYGLKLTGGSDCHKLTDIETGLGNSGLTLEEFGSLDLL